MNNISQAEKRFRVNQQIRVKEVQLIDGDGKMLGVVPISEAMASAARFEMDLVELNPKVKPPLCRLLDYGKFRYEQTKKERESRQKRKIIEIKEVKFRPKIDVHDYETKKKMAVKFLKENDKVKVTVMFRGRESMYRQQGMEIMHKLAEEIHEISEIEQHPKNEGRNMTMVLAPKNNS